MGLMDDVRATQDLKAKGGRRCSMCLASDPTRSTLDPADREDLVAVLKDPNVSASTIAEVLNARGIEIKSGMVQHHRRDHVQGWKESR